MSLLIYLRKSSCVVPPRRKSKLTCKLTFKESLHRNYNIQLLLQGGSDPCLNLKPDKILVHPRLIMHPRIGCSIFIAPLGSSNLKSNARLIVCRSDPRMIGSSNLMFGC